MRCVWCNDKIKTHNRFYHIVNTKEKFRGIEVDYSEKSSLNKTIVEYIEKNGKSEQIIVSGLWMICNNHKAYNYVSRIHRVRYYRNRPIVLVSSRVR